MRSRSKSSCLSSSASESQSESQSQSQSGSHRGTAGESRTSGIRYADAPAVNRAHTKERANAQVAGAGDSKSGCLPPPSHRTPQACWEAAEAT